MTGLANPAIGIGHGINADVPVTPLKERAEQLEGLFLNTLMKEMFSDIKSDGQFGGGYAEETWRGMQAEQISQQISEAGGIGLADDIMGNLIDAQSATSQLVTDNPASLASRYSPVQGTPRP